MITTLPRLASSPNRKLSGTSRTFSGTSRVTVAPICTPTTEEPSISLQKSYSAPSLYGAYPPPELSSSMDFIRIPTRINPLQPKPPKRRINMSWETTDQHWHNEKRRNVMQQREHMRYHSAWSKAFYGAPAEKESYRKHFREVLKQQMNDSDNTQRQLFREKTLESKQALEVDRTTLHNDAEELLKKRAYLNQFRDSNKRYMEERWERKRINKMQEQRTDSERLRYNPINWSCTLK